MASTEELACVYAALILHDEGIEPTQDKLDAVIKASGVEIPPYWTKIFAKFLANQSVSDLIANVGSAPAAAPAAAAGGAEEKQEEEEESEEESEEDLGMGGLF
eukprot:gb/GECH01011139.1/.p1 GENE.gb/GECH01011139.1/~~gb/GECH01011139.1/.p1  ORF type:complete len:103 (+),score=32.70 gb/GECH01011139.1/:1-309(+)